MLQIKLSKSLKEDANNGVLKTNKLVKFILENIEGTSTNKPINNTALKDICFNGQYPCSAKMDLLTGELIIIF
ncbi:MAG TPA: hypothetical protein GX708_22040 [Gallicola sp.]|nr:hypothetical protein [Gallicola sp.]